MREGALRALLRTGRLESYWHLRIGAVAAVAAVGADELAVQAEHLRSAQFALVARILEGLRGLYPYVLFRFSHRVSIRALRVADTGKFSRRGCVKVRGFRPRVRD